MPFRGTCSTTQTIAWDARASLKQRRLMAKMLTLGIIWVAAIEASLELMLEPLWDAISAHEYERAVSLLGA